MTDYYINNKWGASLVDDENSLITELLWGDPISLVGDWDSDTDWAPVRARGEKGWVEKSKLRRKSGSFNGLLEFYIMDVGQGDGILCRTPDDKWHVIDAGVSNSRQMTKKGAANFIRWKFYKDLRRNKISLHSLTASHPDFDHYGGMLDLLSGKLWDGRTFNIGVDNFYHTGMGRFEGNDPIGNMKRGRVSPFPQGDHGLTRSDNFITELLDDKDSLSSPARSLSSSFGDLGQLVGKICGHAQKLSVNDGYLPGYGPESEVTVKILGPVLEKFGNNYGLRKLGKDDRYNSWLGKTRNGHSLIYRFDYGDARILMTGDLNAESQKLLLSYIPTSEFEADVAKGCHHGSEDVHMGFIKAMMARATVISSGDNESYAHPRPVILGASAKYGRESKALDNQVQAPLIYSTELARSVNLDYPTSIRVDPDGSGNLPERRYSAKKTKVKTRNTSYENLNESPLATDLIYGLVNIRTDGKTILCATMHESGKKFDQKHIKAGINVNSA